MPVPPAARGPEYVSPVPVMIEHAAFRDVVVHQVRMTLRLPPPEEFLLRHLAAVLAAQFVAAAGEEATAALVGHMKDAMRPYVDGRQDPGNLSDILSTRKLLLLQW
jgi:hypothetical protein